MRVTFVDNLLLERTAGGYSVDLQPQLGLISLIAVLRKAGHVATLYDPKIDLDAGEIELRAGLYREFAERIAATQPDVVGFTSLGCNFVCTVKIARELRTMRPSTPFIMGGPHASILDREIIERYPEFDAIARHETETIIVPLIDALSGRTALDDVDGLTFRVDGNARRTKDVGPILDLDALPFAAYDAYPVTELGLTELRVDAGRGCPFRCTFCSTASFFGRRYRLKSADRLVDELLRLRRVYGIDRFVLSHDLFTVNKTKVREFCRAVSPYGVHWRCSARIDCVDDALLSEMSAAGCEGIYYGVETGSPRMQKLVAKDLDLTLYHPRVTKTLELGMRAVASFITGYPEETVEDQDATLELIGESLHRYPDALAIQLHLLTPEPGTLLYEQRRDSLAYDGHVTDFNFPAIEPEDEAFIAADPAVFVCHQYYKDGLSRARTIEVTEAFHVLCGLGRPLLRALAEGSTSFSALVRAFGEVLTTHDFRRPAALRAFARTRFGAKHPLTDAMAFVAAHAALRVERRHRLARIPPHVPLRLAECIASIGPALDGEEILRRLAEGESLDDRSLAQSHWLLVGTADLGGCAPFAIDPTTSAIVTELEAGTTQRRLAMQFAADQLEPRLTALCALGAIVAPGTGERQHQLRLRGRGRGSP